MDLTEARKVANVTGEYPYAERCEFCRRLASYIVWGQTERPRGSCTCSGRGYHPLSCRACNVRGAACELHIANKKVTA